MFGTEISFSEVRWRYRGLTLIELLLAIGILGILAALARPSFADVMRKQRVNSMREEW